MSRINTKGVITYMTDFFTHWYAAIGQDICHDMRAKHSHRAIRWKSKRAIAVSSRSCPQPAFFWEIWYDLFPKSCRPIAFVSPMTGGGAKAIMLWANFVFAAQKGNATMGTHKCDTIIGSHSVCAPITG